MAAGHPTGGSSGRPAPWKPTKMSLPQRRSDWDPSAFAQGLDAVTPFTQTDWPNPTRAVPTGPRPIEVVAYRSEISLPNGDIETTLPRRPVRVPVVEALQPLTTLLDQQSTPFAQLQWEKPQAVRIATQTQPQTNLLETTLAQTNPFAQTDWPITRVRVRADVASTKIRDLWLTDAP